VIFEESSKFDETTLAVLKVDMSFLHQIEKNRTAIMSKWLGLVLPEFGKNDASLTGKFHFENPLSYRVGIEFNKLFDYMLSEVQLTLAPVAETLIKFKALGTTSPKGVIDYPVYLKESVLESLRNYPQAQTPKEYELPAIDERTEELLFAASNFYAFTKEKIKNIKIREMKAGTFSTEALGTNNAVCPSAVWEHSVENRLDSKSFNNIIMENTL
jgi:hypothetical protein